jgi:TrmH family RNA methyltransferase
MQSITSRSNGLVAEFRSLAETPDPSGTRLLLDGLHLVQEAEAAGMPFECLAVASTLMASGGDEADLARRVASAGQRVVTVSAPVLRAMSPVQHPSGLVAIVGVPARDRRVAAGPGTFALLLADVQDPGNVGALVRVAEAGGLSHVCVAGASANPFGWRAVRGSMGSALRLPIVRSGGVAAAASNLAEAGIRLVAAVPRGGADPDEVDWRGPLALLLGGEGPGLDAATLAVCSDRVTIPMRAPVESLNVAVAGAILIYAARRHRS